VVVSRWSTMAMSNWVTGGSPGATVRGTVAAAR